MESMKDCPLAGLTHRIIGCAIEVHRALGPGLLEHCYQECMTHELSLRRIPHEAQVHVPLIYKERRLGASFRMDIVVDDAVVIEVKSVEALVPVHFAQVLTYLRLTGRTVGLIMNFNVARLIDGVHRIGNSK